MKKRLTISSMLLSISLFFGATVFSASAFAETIRIGVEGAYPPFSQVDKDGKLSGFILILLKRYVKTSVQSVS